MKQKGKIVAILVADGSHRIDIENKLKVMFEEPGIDAEQLKELICFVDNPPELTELYKKRDVRMIIIDTFYAWKIYEGIDPVEKAVSYFSFLKDEDMSRLVTGYSGIDNSDVTIKGSIVIRRLVREGCVANFITGTNALKYSICNTLEIKVPEFVS